MVDILNFPSIQSLFPSRSSLTPNPSDGNPGYIHVAGLLSHIRTHVVALRENVAIDAIFREPRKNDILSHFLFGFLLFSLRFRRWCVPE